jgi:glycosyltransferase involved in cell wall biosynthesis
VLEIHAIILTLNEEIHLGRCLASLADQASSVTIVDCGSTDRTTEIARDFGADVLTNVWVNYATQMNFGIDALAGRGGWLFRIDADEVLDLGPFTTLPEVVTRVDDECDGILVQRRIHFLGRRIRHGSIEPSWQLRLWRNGRGRCEQRWMDEHIKVQGKIVKSEIVLADINLNTLSWWTTKHNSYASREAIDQLNARYRFLSNDGLVVTNASNQARLRRFVKEKIYLNVPAGIRVAAYFVYRYILRLGFLDGKEGYYFHILQALWYRTLVDAKVVEIEAYAREKDVSIVDAISDRTGIPLMSSTKSNKCSHQIRRPNGIRDR